MLLSQASSQSNPIIGFVPMILMFAIIYFLLILPMQRQKKKQQRMLSELKNGDVVQTTGGLVGTIVGINDDETLLLKVKPDNVRLQVVRSAVSGMKEAAK